MNLSCGIVGLPNSGKSTLFNALLKRQIAQVAEYPYTTIEPNVGVVEVPDERLSSIADRLSIGKIVPAAIKFIDVAGLIKGAHQGEGLGNQFLGHIREVDAIIHVVRAFKAEKVEHVSGKIDPEVDIEIVNDELFQAGIDKPAIYVINASESDLNSTSLIRISEVLKEKYHTYAFLVCAKLEAELAELPEDEQKAYLKELGVEKSALDEVISQSFKLLDLITFFTIAGGKMVQAWPVKRGTTMVEAAEKVHSDFAKGFITAEVCDWQKLVETGSWHAAKTQGKVATIGKNEEMPENMVVEFKFSV